MAAYHYQYLNPSTYYPSSPMGSHFTILHPTLAETSAVSTARKKARSSTRTLCRAFLVGGLIATGVFGMGVTVISYLCLAHKCQIEGRSLVSTAPLGKALTISQVGSHVAPVTIPLLMGLSSYRFAAKWLKASEMEGLDRPSPMQLGLLLSIFNSANIPSLFSAVRYSLGFGQSSQQKSFPAPSILRRATVLLSFFLITAYLITGSDAWLHVTSKAVIIKSLIPYNSKTGTFPSEPFGRIVNNTKCEQAQLLSSSFQGLSCGQLSGGSGGDGFSRMPGLRTLSNSSSIHSIAYANDQTAIVVPATIPSNISYSASTIGIKSSCKTITKECLSPTMSGDLVDYGPNAFLNVKCNSDTHFNATHDFGMQALDETGNASDAWNVSSNPFHVGAVITSMAYYNDDLNSNYDDFVGDSGWFVHGNMGAWNVLYCDMTVLDVNYTFRSSTSEFTVISSSPSSLRNTRAVVTFGLTPYSSINQVATVVDGAGLQTKTTYEEAYALELSRQTIARGAVMYITQDTVDISKEVQVIGTKIDLIPFVIMLGMMSIYGCTVLLILLQAMITVSRTSYVQLASSHLTNPLTTVHALHGPKDALYTWQDKTLEKFGVESHCDRLNIGEFGGDGGIRRFAVQKSGAIFDTSSFGK